MRFVMDKMQLTTECIVISLIYLEQIMITGNIEIRNFNWRPLVFTAILLASKFWEDIIWYNVDFEENCEIFPLKSINRMESEFISLCDYNIYCSADKYNRYQAMVKEISNPVMDNIQRKTSFMSNFNLSQNQEDSFNTDDEFVLSDANKPVVSSAGKNSIFNKIQTSKKSTKLLKSA